MRQNPRQLAFDWGEAGEAQPGPSGGSPPAPATDRAGTLAHGLMEAVVDADNMRQALKKVRANKGSPGADGMTVQQLPAFLKGEWPRLKQALLAGTYQPEPVRRVEIPKPDGGVRLLGIPTALDRLIQQAILQVLDPLYNPTFSRFSYGFRPGKSAHEALAQARRHVASGKGWVVDLDLEKFFDRVNHDLLMGRLAQRIGDKRLLRLIRRYLEAGVLFNGVVIEREEGTPQGGPLSPLLSNVLLDELDRELERRGHCFCRYADDCNIYVGSRRSGERVMASVCRFLASRLQLKVNESKSAVARSGERKFLGFTISNDPEPTRQIAAKALEKFKERVRELTCRTLGVSVPQLIAPLARYLIG
jgi:RNA-directed DNA polymerase